MKKIRTHLTESLSVLGGNHASNSTLVEMNRPTFIAHRLIKKVRD